MFRGSRFNVIAFATIAVAMLPALAHAGHDFRRTVAATEAQEVPAPPAPSGGTASGLVTVDTNTNTITYNITCSGLNGTINNAHFHGPAAPGLTASVKISLTADVVGNTIIGSKTFLEIDQPSILAGLFYLNVHTTLNPAGQVRDQIVLVEFPASGNTTLLMLGGLLAIGGAAFMLRRRATA